MSKTMFLGILVVLVSAVLVYFSGNLHREYKRIANKALESNKTDNSQILSPEDIRHLPEPVRKYIAYTGAIGKEKVYNFRVAFGGKMWMNQAGWVKTEVEQRNYYGSHLTRLFYMKLNLLGFLPILGLHSYTDEAARMHIKAAGLFPVVDVKGKEMRISDTVTLFNDMCLMAPGALTDKRIQWETAGENVVKAVFRTDYCTVTSLLYFNDKGELVNFTSDDRYRIENDGSSRKFQWSTPLSDYKEINGMKLASHIDVVWDLPEGKECYLKVENLRELSYNASAKESDSARR